MTEGKNVVQGSGRLEVIKQDTTKTGKAYFKIKIGEKWGNFFDFNAGKELESSNLKGQEVKYFAEETQSGDRVFTNFKSIFVDEPVDSSQEETVSNVSDKSSPEITPLCKQEEKNPIAPGLACQQIKIITSNTEADFEQKLNEFLKTHKVFATQTNFQMFEGTQKFLAALYYK